MEDEYRLRGWAIEMAEWETVVSRSLCSRLVPGDCHGSTNSYHCSAASSETVKDLTSLRLELVEAVVSDFITEDRIGNVGSCSDVAAGSRGSSQWTGQAAASVEATTASSSSAMEVEVPKEVEIGAVGSRFEVHVAQICIQEPREEMEDNIIVQDGPLGFTYSGVFDGHADFATAEFCRFQEALWSLKEIVS